jgi:hypothetical protein
MTVVAMAAAVPALPGTPIPVTAPVALEVEGPLEAEMGRRAAEIIP